MKLQITTANKIENPPKNYGFAFIDAEDNKFKIKKYDSIIEFSNDLSDVQLLDLTDYTAFEVFPTSKTYAPGEFSYQGYTNGVEISAQDTHHFVLRSLYTQDKQDVVIDWGDGTTTVVKEGGDDVIIKPEYSNTNFFIRHKYTELDKPYIVKIYGTTYFGFMSEAKTRYIDDGSGDAKCYLNHNLISRIFDVDLPVAKCVTNTASMCQYARRLLKVYVYGHSILRQSANWTLTFSGCKNMISAGGFEDDNLKVAACSEIFKNCTSLTYTDFRVPEAPRSSGVTASIYEECNSLAMDVADLLPKANFMTTPYEFTKMFYNTKVVISDSEKVASKLWNNPNIEFTGIEKVFGKCTKETKALVPTSWCGTASNNIIIEKYSEKITKIEEDLSLKQNQINGYYYPINGEELLNYAETIDSGVIYLNPGNYKINRPLIIKSNCSLIGAGGDVTSIIFSPDDNFTFESMGTPVNYQNNAKELYVLSYEYPYNFGIFKKCSNKAIIHLASDTLDSNKNINVSFVNIEKISIRLDESIVWTTENTPDYGLLGNDYVKLSKFEQINVKGNDLLKAGMLFPYIWGSNIENCRVENCELGFGINASTSLTYSRNYALSCKFVGHFFYDLHYSSITSCATDKTNPYKDKNVYSWAYKLSNLDCTNVSSCGAEWCNGSFMYIESLKNSTISNCATLALKCVNDISSQYGFDTTNISEANLAKCHNVASLFSLNNTCYNSIISNIGATNMEALPENANVDCMYDIYFNSNVKIVGSEIKNMFITKNSSGKADNIFGWTNNNSNPKIDVNIVQ